MAYIRPKFRSCVKRGFLGYYLSQSIMSHHAKMFQKKLCDNSWGIRLNNFRPNWVQILHLLEKGIFWENTTQLFSTHYATMSQKKYWQIMWYKVLKLWTKLDTNHPLNPTRDFLKKTDWYFCLLQIPQHNTTMFKKKSLK